MADNEILCQPFVFISLYLQILFYRIKAWTSFHGIQIMMSHNQCFRKLSFQLSQQSKQSPFLLQCARILRLSVRIQSAFITSTYRVGIVIPAMCPDLFKRSSPVDFSVPCDIEMIPDVAEPTMADMVQTTGFRRKGFPLRRSTAMNDNQCDRSHRPTYSFVFRTLLR